MIVYAHFMAIQALLMYHFLTLMNAEIHKVLILDDDRILAQLMADYLSLSAHCYVTQTHKSEDFWKAYQSDSYDLIFMDFRLPDTTGLDILEKLAAQDNITPIVMMTGEGSEEIAVKAIQSGAFDYLVKGHFEFSVLPTLLTKAIRQHKIQAEIKQNRAQIDFQAALLNNVSDSVVGWDLHNRITYWNPVAAELFSLSAHNAIGKQAEDMYFNLFEPPICTTEDTLPASGTAERKYKDGFGAERWVNSKITPLFDEQHTRITGYMDIAREITTTKSEQQEHLSTQHFLEKIIASSPDIIYIADLTMNTLSFVNPQILEILSIPANIQDSSLRFSDLVHPEDLASVNQHHHEVYSEPAQTRIAFEFRMRDTRGVWNWYSSHETIFSRDLTGNPKEVIGIAQDITANKVIGNQLQQRLIVEKLLSSISNFFINISPENTDMGIEKSLLLVGNYIRPDLGAIYLTENKNFFSYYCGFEKSVPDSRRIQERAGIIEIRNFPWLKGELKSQQPLLINNTAELPFEAIAEMDFLAKHGIKSIIFVPMVYNSEMIGIVTVVMNHETVTWQPDHVHLLQTFADLVVNAIIQKRAAQEVQSSEARYRAIVEEHQTELIFRIDPLFLFTFVNETFCNYYKKARSDLIGTPFQLLINAEDFTKVEQAILACTPASPITQFEMRTLVANSFRWQEWTIRAIFKDNSTIIDYQGVGRDINQRKEIEHQLKTAQTHLAQTTRMAAIGELAASIAHQISNPLTTIIAEAQLLVNSIPNQHADYESASAIVEAGWRAQHVIRELLKFSEAPKNDQDEIAINETIEKAVLLAGTHIQKSGSTILNIALEPGLPPVCGNSQQLEDLWLTLLLLARSATLDDKKHTVQICTQYQAETEEVMVSVIDDGIPISPQQMETIFEPQLVPRGQGRGTGIELSLCREIVRQHAGKISVKMKNGLTIFEISLPGERKNGAYQHLSN